MIKRYALLKGNKHICYCDSIEECTTAAQNHSHKDKSDFSIHDIHEDVFFDIKNCLMSKPAKKLTQRGRIKPRPRKQKKNDVIDPSYCKWLGTQPCVITNKVSERGQLAFNTHCHHIEGRVPMNDYEQVPLAGHVHSWGPYAYHNMSEQDFIAHWGIDCDDIKRFFKDHAKRLREKYKAQGGLLLIDAG